MSRLSSIGLLCALVVGVCSCGEETPTYADGCPNVVLNQNLHPIFYWGYDDEHGSFKDYLPNTGYPASDTRCPQWMSADSILVVSYVSHNGAGSIGVFSVHVEPASLAYKGVTEYPYAGGIRLIRWDNVSGGVFVLDYYGGAILRCHLDPTGLVADEEVVGADWQPAYMCSWPGHDGIAFSGIDPMSSVAGVYWRRPAATDSLLFAPSGSEALASRFSFTADGQHLLVGLNVPPDRTCALVSVPMQPPGVPSVIVTRSQYAIQAEANPTDPDIATFVYHFVGDDTNPPEDFVEIVRLSTGDATKLNVRTHTLTCHFTRVESVSWDPTGRNLALASGAEDGEGGKYRFQLWAFQDVPIK